MADATNVRIVISAITEAAQQAIDEVGNELTGIADDAEVGQTTLDQFSDELTETTSRAALAQSAIDEVGDEALSASVKTQALKSAQESLGDEFDQNTAKALANAGALQTNAASATAASGSYGLLSKTMLLSLIPAILTLSTVLAPLAVLFGAIAAGAAALAGAFGLIVGSGILAFGQERAKQNQQRLNQVNSQIEALERLQQSEAGLTQVQKRRLKRLKEEKQQLDEQTTITGALGAAMADLKDEILPLITQFGQEFIPLIEDALDAIPTLVEEMLGAVGGTEEFREALRRFGGLMMEVLPALTGLMFDLAREALPVLEEFVSFLQDNGDGALQAMQASLTELTPEFRGLLDALIEMAPVLLEFGTNVAEVVVPALEDAVRLVTAFMQAVNSLPEPLDSAAGGMLVALPLFVKFSGVLGALIPSAYNLGRAFGAVRFAVAGLLGAVPSLATVMNVLGQTFAYLANPVATFTSLSATTAAAAAAVGAAIGLVVVKIMDMVGVLGAIGDAGAAFGKMMGKWIDPFLALISVLSLGVIPLLGALGGIIIGLVRGDLQGGVENAKQILGTFVDAFYNTYDMIAGFFADLADLFMSFIGNSIIIDILVDGLQHMTSVFIGFFTKTLPAIIFGFLSDVAQGFINFFTKTLPQVAVQGLGAFIALIEQQFNRVFNVIADIWNGLVELVAGATEALINAGVDAINSFLSTLDDVGDKVGQIPGVSGVDVGTLDRVSIDRDIGQVDRRETDFQTLRDRRTEDVQNVVQGGITVNVEGEDFGRNPREDSRVFADQLRREIRNDSGAN